MVYNIIRIIVAEQILFFFGLSTVAENIPIIHVAIDIIHIIVVGIINIVIIIHRKEHLLSSSNYSN